MLRLDMAASRWVRALPQIYLVHWADLTGPRFPSIPTFSWRHDIFVVNQKRLVKQHLGSIGTKAWICSSVPGNGFFRFIPSMLG